jgi:hypothetical protein
MPNRKLSFAKQVSTSSLSIKLLTLLKPPLPNAAQVLSGLSSQGYPS